tara:strand:+ start:2659 stop:3255 length:597 start_codon:yes stop_codon:yes gene_type:complete
MGDSILSTNHRERERQIKNISRVARGGKVEKKIYVQMEDLDEKKKRQEQVKLEREEKNNRSEALKEARTPWFCPSCKKIMKKRLDDKMYRLYEHCFDCQIKFENKLRLEGKYKSWERRKILKNKLSWIEEQTQGVEDWRVQSVKPIEVHNSVGVKDIELEREKWDVDVEKINQMATEAMEEFEKMKVETQEELESIED